MKTHLTDVICSIFAQVLQISGDHVYPEKSFFELGGTSMTALKAVALLKETISNHIDVKFFFSHLSAKELAKHLEELP